MFNNSHHLFPAREQKEKEGQTIHKQLFFFRWCAWQSAALKPVESCILWDHLMLPKQMGQKVCRLVEQTLSTDFSENGTDISERIPSSSLDFTFLWGYSWSTFKFTQHCCFHLSHPLTSVLNLPLVKGLEIHSLFCQV